MAIAQLIDLSNYDTLLVQSTDARAGVPDGNIYFDNANGLIELITKEELAQVDLGSGLEDNPLADQEGIAIAALYAFEAQERRTDEELRKYDKYFKGTFKYAGAYEIINSRKFAATDRVKLRGSGWIERASDGGVDRIYFGGRSLGNVEAASLPYYQLILGGAPTNYDKAGPVDEAVQVLGSTANVPSDATAGDFDTRTYYAMSIRTYGFNMDRKILADSGLTTSDGYAAGFAIVETAHITTIPATYPLADVYGGAQVAPFTGMTLEKLAVAQTETGFVEADGDFTWVLHNTANASLDECIAYLDALAQTDEDIDVGTITITNGKRVNTWYSYNATGQVVTRSGADTLGLFIENVPTADQQRVTFTDDVGSVKTYPFQVQVEITVGSLAVADVLAWYHVYYADGAGVLDFNTVGAVTVSDSTPSPVKGNVSADATGIKIIFTYAYDTNTEAGLVAGEDKVVIVEVEGDGGVTAAKTEFTITRNAIVAATCAPTLETNV